MIQIITTLLFILMVGACKAPTKKISKEEDKLKMLVSPADTSSSEPYLFTDKNGVVYVSWIEKVKGKSFLKFCTFNNGQWSKPSTISSGDNWFVNWADYPMLASDGGDNMIAHILEKSGKTTYAYDVKLITSLDRGNSWSDLKILHDDGKKAEHGFVSMLPYGENYFISWLDGRNTSMGAETEHGDQGEMSVRAVVVNKKGIKSDEWELDNRVCDCCQTSAAVTANGPIVVYRDRSKEEIRDISIVRLVNGEWTKPKPIFSDNWKIEGCPVNGPRADAQGNNLAVSWFSSPDKTGQVNVIFSQDGGATFNPPFRIDEGEAIGRVDIIMLDEKSAMVCWMEGSIIKAARVHNNGKKDPSIIIASSSVSRSSGFPQMTRSGNNIVFAWTDDKEKTIKLASLSL